MKMTPPGMWIILLTCCTLSLAGGCARQGPLGDPARRSGNISAVGWLPDGRLILATGRVDEAARLWTASRDERSRPIPFVYCKPIKVLSIFPLQTPDRIGLTVWCGDPPAFRMISMNLRDASVDLLVETPTTIDDGVWSGRTSTGYAEYGENGCTGVGEIKNAEIGPLTFEVPTADGSSLSLNSLLPSPLTSLGSPCAARVLAKRPDISESGRYLAFFVRICSDRCSGLAEFESEWQIVIHDSTTGRNEVMSRQFSSPRGLAISEHTGLVISGRYEGVTGIWHCAKNSGCEQPRRLAEGVLNSPSFNRDGAELIAIDNNTNALRYIPTT